MFLGGKPFPRSLLGEETDEAEKDRRRIRCAGRAFPTRFADVTRLDVSFGHLVPETSGWDRSRALPWAVNAGTRRPERETRRKVPLIGQPSRWTVRRLIGVLDGSVVRVLKSLPALGDRGQACFGQAKKRAQG